MFNLCGTHGLEPVHKIRKCIEQKVLTQISINKENLTKKNKKTQTQTHHTAERAHAWLDSKRTFSPFFTTW